MSANFCKQLARWAAVIALTSGYVVSVAADDPTLNRIRQRSTVVIGYRAASVPLSYRIAEGPVGYSIDVCQRIVSAISRDLGIKNLRVEFKEVTSANRLSAVQSGEIDLECGSTTNTVERRKLVAFTIPHFIATSRLMVRSDDRYERIEDLAGRTVASTTGTTNVGSLKHQADLKGIELHVVEARDHDAAVAWLLEGKIDAFAMDDVLLFGLRANSRNPALLKVIGSPITVEPYAISFAKDAPDLKAIADSTMRQLIYSGDLRKLYDKWFTSSIPPKGMNLAMPMSGLLADSLRFPTDFVPN